jgi:hypothetical protein
MMLNEQEVADRVAERLVRLLPAGGSPGVGPGTNVERSLEELVALLRQQQRQSTLQEDFSYAKLGALILQVLVVGAVLLGLKSYVTAPVTYKEWSDYFAADFAHLGAVVWLLIAVTLQGMVLALLVRTRTK